MANATADENPPVEAGPTVEDPVAAETEAPADVDTRAEKPARGPATAIMEFLRTPLPANQRRKVDRPRKAPEPVAAPLELPKARTGKHLDSYGDEGYYDGEFQDGLRHGKGTFVFRGFRYDGEWRKDKMEGKGKRVDADGSTYYGDWKEDREHGYGHLSNADGTAAYAGEWRHGKRHGHGRQVFDHGDAYDGEWDNGQFHNRGTYFYKNGDKYTGRWQRGVAHGEGTMFFADGSQSRRVHDRGRLVTLQDFDLALGKHGQVVRREDMAKPTTLPSRISALT